jgi:hypothetical protein
MNRAGRLIARLFGNFRLEINKKMVFRLYFVGIATLILGCGGPIFLSPAANVKPGEYLIRQRKATIYGQIQNQKRDVHLVISKKGSLIGGSHLLGDSSGLFMIQVDSGTYRLYNDRINRPSDPTPGAKIPGFPSDCHHLHHEFTVSNRTLVYIGSLFLTDDNIDIQFEKPTVDSLMKTKYPNFKVGRTAENYPERLPMDSVVCVQGSNSSPVSPVQFSPH